MKTLSCKEIIVISGESFPRKWKVWAHIKPDGELAAITYQTGLVSPYGPFTESECETDLQKKLWAFALEQVAMHQSEVADDYAVIEPWPSGNIIRFPTPDMNGGR